MIKDYVRMALIVCTSLKVLTTPCYADSWQDIVAKVEQELQQTKQDNLLVRSSIQQEKDRLSAELESLRQQVSLEQAKLGKLQASFGELLQTEEEMKTQMETEEMEIQNLQETFRAIAGDAETMVRNSIVSAEIPSRLDNLQPLLYAKHFPGIEDIQLLADTFFQEMEASGQIRKHSGTFVDSDGKPASGEIVRVGKFTALYQSSSQAGYLRYDPTRQQFVAVQGGLPWSDERDL